MALINVIIPAYNCEKSLKKTVESIISADLKEYEIIIINDGSSDNTAEVCENLCAEYDFISCFEQENSGVSAARNRGISHSNGEYIVFFDADDTVTEKGFSKCVEIIEKEKPDILVFGMRFDYYKNGKIYRSDDLVSEQNGILTKAQIREQLESLFDTNSLASSCNKFYKKSLLVENGVFFDTNKFLMEDFLFSLNSLNVCDNIYCFPEALYCYEQAEDEKNAFNRLKRIDNLCEYVYPFKEAINKLSPDEKGDRLFNKFFFMLLWQKMYYSEIKSIKKIVEEFKNSKLYEEIDSKQIPEEYAGLYNDVKNDRCVKIRLLNLKTQIRHKIAVFVKSLIRR